MTQRETHKFDASGQSIGRLASKIAIILRGKNKPEFEPHIDNGDIVEVTNIKEVKFTGKKLDQKKYFRYSGYPGGLKEVKMRDMYNSRPDEVLKRSVKEMLPNNKLRVGMIKRLIIK